MKCRIKTNVIFRIVIVIIINSGLRTAGFRDKNKIMKSFKIKEDNTAILGLQTIQRKGYPLETHEVNTANGYILTLHRIPHGLSSEGAEKRRPILLQHGMFQSSISWMINKGNNSLAYLLVDNGFDVWLGNNRGNPYSNKHSTLSSLNFLYWDFSFHEMGTEDLPNVIDYILEKTNKKKLSYVGFSMGTTQLFIAMSMRPEYNAKVHVSISLAPVVLVDHGHNPLLVLGRLPITSKTLEISWTVWENPDIYYNLMLHEFMRKTFQIGSIPDQAAYAFIDKIFPEFCRKDRYSASLCSVLIFSIMGSNPGQFDQHELPTILHGTSYTSFKNIVHFTQISGAKRFQLFDYDSQNIDIYGRVIPPAYPLDKVTVPTVLMWSNNDYLSSDTDVARLTNLLPNVVNNYRIPLDDFSHYDFLYGLDAYTLVNEHLLKNLRMYDTDDVSDII